MLRNTLKLLENCKYFMNCYQKQIKGTLNKKKQYQCLQNLMVMAGRDAVTEFAKLNPKMTDSELDDIYQNIEKWENGDYKCYRCENLGCSEEQIKACHCCIRKNEKGEITNSQFDICNLKRLAELQKVQEAEDRIEDYADEILDGKKILMSDTEVINTFALVSKTNPSKVESIIEEIKKADIPCLQFEKRILKIVQAKEQVEENVDSTFTRLDDTNASEMLKAYLTDLVDYPNLYITSNGHIVSIISDNEEREVCNFIPVIDRKYVVSDGVDTECSVDIHLLINGTYETDSHRILNTDLQNNRWISKYFGAEAVLYTNTCYDSIFCVLSSLAEKIPPTQINYSLGWKSGKDNKFGYSFSGKCLGHNEIACTEIPELYNYELSEEECSVEDSYKAFSQMLYSLMPEKQASTMMLIAFIFNSPLLYKMTELGIPNKSLCWLYGVTGSFKSETAKLALAYWGKVKTLPASFQDTIASIERKMNLAADALLVIDDFCPSSTKAEEMRKIQLAQRVTRNIGDRISRGRAKSNMSLAKSYVPKCNVLVTGEDVLEGMSTLSRHLSVELCKGDVDVSVLTYLQKHSYLLAGFMMYYLLWLKDNVYDQCNYDLYKLFVDYRNSAGNESQHRRFAETVAQLNVSMYMLSEFLLNNNLIAQNEKDELLEKSNNAFLEFAETQNRAVMAEDPADMFMSALHELIATGQIKPANPKVPDYSMQNSNPVFFDGKEYWLSPSSTYAKIVSFCFEKGSNFPLSERATWSCLADKKYLVLNNNADGYAKYKFRVKIGSGDLRVIKINKDILDNF